MAALDKLQAGAAMEILQRRCDRQDSRLRSLEEEVRALRGCLAEAGVVRTATLDAQLHRLRFSRARQLHPLTSGGASRGVALLQVLRAGDLTTHIAHGAGAVCLEALAPACRQAHDAAKEALPRIAAWWPRLLYVCGGLSQGRRLDCAECFDPSGEGGGHWSTMPPMLERRSGASGARMANGLVACGGKSDSIASLSSVEFFDSLRGAWEVLPPMRTQRSHAAAVVVGGRLHVCGGFDGRQYLNSCTRYCPKERAWLAVPAMLERRSHAVAASLGGCLLVCGGKGEGSLRFREVERLRPGAAEWELMPPMLGRRSQAAGAVSAGTFYVCGGFDGVQHVNSVECLSIGAKGWKALPPMAEPRSSAVAAALGGRLYVCGGLNGGAHLSTVEVFELSTKTWSRVPPMSVSRAHATAATLWSLPKSTEKLNREDNEETLTGVSRQSIVR